MRIYWIIILLFLICPTASHAMTVTLAWDANDSGDQVIEYTVYEDGVEVANVDGSITTATINNVTNTTHSFWVTATNLDGNGDNRESDASNVVVVYAVSNTTPRPASIIGFISCRGCK
jgi:hypothetical protein